MFAHIVRANTMQIGHLCRVTHRVAALGGGRVFSLRRRVSFMRLRHILHTAAFFAYFSKVRVSHIFPHKLAFSTAVIIFFVFPLLVLISIRFRYLDRLVANRMPTSMCPNPVERDGVVGFKQFCAIFQHISTVYVVFIRSAYFF